MLLSRVVVTLAMLSMCGHFTALRAQDIEVEIDPLAYALKGFSIHGAIADQHLRADLGLFGIQVPDGFHGNSGMTQFTQGVGLKVQYSFNEDRSGAFVGIGTDYSWSTYGSGSYEVQEGAPSVGINSGYRFAIGSSGFYITPWIGVDYTFASNEIIVGTQTFTQSSIRFFPTVHLGWRF